MSRDPLAAFVRWRWAVLAVIVVALTANAALMRIGG